MLRPATISLGRTSPHGSCSLPGTSAVGLRQPPGDEQPPAPKGVIPAWPCSRWGLPGRAYCYARRWSLTPPFHPHLRRTAKGSPRLAVCFCGPIRQVPGPAAWPPTCPRPGCYPASCSMECGLSSMHRTSRLRLITTPRSPDRPGYFHHNISTEEG